MSFTGQYICLISILTCYIFIVYIMIFMLAISKFPDIAFAVGRCEVLEVPPLSRRAPLSGSEFLGSVRPGLPSMGMNSYTPFFSLCSECVRKRESPARIPNA